MTDMLSSTARGQADKCFFDEPPLVYRSDVNNLVKQARSLLEHGETVPFSTFLAVDTTGSFAPLISTAACGPLTSEQISFMAAITGASAILTISESWRVRSGAPLSAKEIRKKYGTIEASPYATEACSIVLETRVGIWLAHAEIKRRSIGGRSFGEVKFVRADSAWWQQVRLLPDQQ
jgi:hypothetical protein